MTYVMFRLLFLAYMFLTGMLTYNFLSNLAYGKKTNGKEFLFLLTWPLALASKRGRKKVLNKLKGVNK